MKVLWLTNSVLPDARSHMGCTRPSSGPWMPTLLDSLVQRAGIEIHVGTLTHEFPASSFSVSGVRYSLLETHRSWLYNSARDDLGAILRLVDEVAPDVIHVHGTELEYGLICRDAAIARKTLVSLQGLIGPYASWCTGQLTFSQQLSVTSLPDLLRGKGIAWIRRNYRRRGAREREIIRKAQHFAGRTKWDEAYVKSLNSEAQYTNLGECLRRNFHATQWSVAKADPNTIIFTNVSGPIKGTEVLLEAVAILRTKIPGVRLRLAGNLSRSTPYGRWIRRRAESLKVDSCLEPLGYLDAASMANSLASSSVFVSCSYIDNSPNSICEAQLCGMPVVASYVGGVPSLISDGKDGVLVPPGNPEILAYYIESVLKDENFAADLGGNARDAALRRHDSDRITDEAIALYVALSDAKES